MNLSLAFLTLQDCGPLEAIEAAAAAGFQSVGLRLLPATAQESPYPLLYDDQLLGQVHALLASTGVSVSDVELVRLAPQSTAEQFEPLLERAAVLGARHVVLVNDDPEPTRLVERWGELCDRAAPYELNLELEPMTWTATARLDQARKALAAVQRPNAGILVDALHFHRSGNSMADFEAIPDSQLHLFQLCDVPLWFDPDPEALRRVSRGERLLPGEGELDLLPLLQRLPVHTTISVEVPNRKEEQRYPAKERARRAWEATQRLIEGIRA